MEGENVTLGGLLFAALAALGKIGWWDKRKPSPESQRKGHSIHNDIIDIKNVMSEMKKAQDVQKLDLALLGERQVTKDIFNEKMNELKDQLHERISDHVEKFHSKAA